MTDRLAGTLTGLAAAALAAGTLVAFALTRTPGGLFNFQERGLQPAPQALIALVAEVGVLVVRRGVVRRRPRGAAARFERSRSPACNPASYPGVMDVIHARYPSVVSPRPTDRRQWDPCVDG